METTLQIDWTTIVGILALAQAAMLSLYLVVFHHKKIEVWLVVGFVLSIIIALGHDILLHSRLSIYLPQMLGFGPFSTYLSGPLILFVAVKLIWPERKFKAYDLLHTLPFIAHFFYRSSHYFGDTQGKLDFLVQYYQNLTPATAPPEFTLTMVWGTLVFYGHRFIYITIALYLMKKHRAVLQHALVPRQQFYRLIEWGLIVYCGGWLVLRCLKSIPYTFGAMMKADLMINSLALSIAVIGLALVLFRYSLDDIFSSKSTQKYQQNRMEDDLSQQIVEQMQSLLTTNNLFCDNDLKLTHLAEKSGLSTQLISQALNSQQQMNFNDFLNQFRLTHIKAQLLDPANSKADIQQLALQSGFNSKATFYRVFKDKVGMTPSEFRKNSPSF